MQENKREASETRLSTGEAQSRASFSVRGFCRGQELTQG